MLGALFGFSGRLSRPGFWEVLASIVLIDAALLIGRMYVADAGLPGGLGPQSPAALEVARWTPWVLAVFTVWSLLAAMVKRFHDRGRTGGLILLGLIPVIGWLWLLVDLFVLKGTQGKNRYGRAPHAPPADHTPAFNWGAEAPVAAAAAAEAQVEPHHHGEAPDAPEAEAHRHAAPADDHHEPAHHDQGHDGHGEGAEGHDEEHPPEAAHSDDGHGADAHAAAEPESHADHAHAPETHHHHSPAPVVHDGGAAAASHAAGHVTVAHSH